MQRGIEKWSEFTSDLITTKRSSSPTEEWW